LLRRTETAREDITGFAANMLLEAGAIFVIEANPRSDRAERDIALVRLISPNTTLLISSSSHDTDMQPAGIDPQNRAMLANEHHPMRL
jgi:hypothetical protein